MAFFNLTDHEYRYRETGGSFTAWTPCTVKPIPTGDINIAIGDFQVRVKAMNGNPAGNILSNDSAFTATPAQGPRVMIYALGDSLTYGSGSTDPATKAPGALIADQLGADFMNLGVGGTEMTRMETEAQYTAIPHKVANEANYDIFIALVSGGTNDISMDIDSALVISRLAHVHEMLQTAGIKAIDITMTATNEATEAGILARIPKHRALLTARRNNWLTWGADAFVDVAKDEEIGQFHLPWNTMPWFTDGQHMTDAGYAKVASIVKPAVEAVIAGNSYGVVGENWPIKYNGDIVPDAYVEDPANPYGNPGITTPEGGVVFGDGGASYVTTAGTLEVYDTVQETDSRIVYDGTWITATGTYYDGNGLYSHSTGISAAVKFHGTRLIYTTHADPLFQYDIIIDGVLWKTVIGAPGASGNGEVTKTIISGLADAVHTLVIRPSGGKWAMVDKIEVTPPTGYIPVTPTAVVYEDNSTDLTFTNFNAPISAAPYSGGTTRQAGGTNTATVTLEFEVTGAANEGLDFYAYINGVSWRYQIDGGAWSAPVLATSQPFTTPHGTVRGLAAGTHTVVLEYSGSPIPFGECNFDKIVVHTNAT